MRDNQHQLNTTSGLTLSSSESESILEAFAFPVRYLFKLYETAVMENEIQEITVLPSKGRAAWSRSDIGRKVVVKEPITSEFGFQELPINLQLKIFSYLDARSVCTAAIACRYWSMLSEDKILWMNLMQRDMHQWSTMGYQSCPSTYIEARSDLTLKQIYLQCCPECRSLRRSRKSSFKSIVFYNLQNLSSLFKRKSPRVVMFGPGLESDTRGLVRQLLHDRTSPFEMTGMFPGKFDGMGSGLCLKLDDVEFNLITLYASNMKDREANARLGRPRLSKLLVDVDDASNDDGIDSDESQQSDMRLRHSVRELCKTIDGFIYVVDSSADSQRVNLGDRELSALMNKNWTQVNAPLLVLSTVSQPDTPALSCATVVELLQLRQFNRPWQVNAACVESLEGILSGIKWLLNSCSI
ncbi:F-box only protein 4-like [Montipora capricornis]|uniref:F-box only protein 4-like n=1 Tax=Montipora capricornis TaxID=246305 RepID=UPI0035F1BBCE